MDFNTSLRKAIKTGKVVLGQNMVREIVEKGKAQLVIIAQNCPPSFREFIQGREGVPLYVFEGTGMQLGKACGKPFVVSALAVIESGDSDILSLRRG